MAGWVWGGAFEDPSSIPSPSDWAWTVNSGGKLVTKWALILNSIASLLANVKVSASVVVVLMNKLGACHFVNVDATLNNI